MFPNHITKLKDGVKVDFYSEEGEIVSKLTSIYGEINYETGKFFVRDSVELLNVKKGQKIEKGEIVGTLGQSGRATGPHLDIRLNWFEIKLDPMTILN